MYDLVLAGNVAVIAVIPACLGSCMGDRRELRLYDISSNASSAYLSTLRIPADHILADANTLYISSTDFTDFSHNNFYIVDITTPSAPIVVSTTTVSDAGYLAKKDNIVYLSRILLYGSPDKYKDIESIDVSDKAHPSTQNGSPWIAFNQTYSPIIILGDALYYLDDAGLNIVDIADRANPSFVRTISLQGGRGQSFAAYNNKLYVAAGSSGVMIFDVSQPKNPVYVKSMKTATDALTVTISNGIGAYLTDRETVPAPIGTNIVSGYKLSLFYDK